MRLLAHSFIYLCTFLLLLAHDLLIKSKERWIKALGCRDDHLTFNRGDDRGGEEKLRKTFSYTSSISWILCKRNL